VVFWYNENMKNNQKIQRKIILASASPRRKELLDKTGLKFRVVKSHYKEAINRRLSPRQVAVSLSIGKAKAVAKKYKDAIIIAADTFIVFKGKILGKPKTAAKAKEMLRKMSRKSHSVITGFTIIDTQKNKVMSQSAETKVYFKKLKPREIDFYVKSKESLDKAGAYAIQGLGTMLIKKVEGDYFNVVGLPIASLAENLKKFGINVL